MKAILTVVAGALLVVAGIAMLVLPGPGWLAILAGLAVLARRFQWAHRLLAWVRDRLPRQVAESRPATLAVPDSPPGGDRARDDGRDGGPAVPAA